MNKLIINADDFGWDDDTLECTINLIERKWITSATIMTGRPATSKALEYAKRTSNRVSFGLHFNIVDGQHSLSRVPNSLVDQEGLFRSSDRQRLAALFGVLKAVDIAQELRSQLLVLQRAGITVSHVDSHGHLHKFPLIAHAMLSVLDEFKITKVRRPQDTYRYRSLRDGIDNYCTWRFPKTIRTTDHYYALDSVAEDWFLGLAKVLKPGITELSLHPGQSEEWRRRECAPLMQRHFSEIKTVDASLITYRDF